MPTELELKAYKLVDEYLNTLSQTDKGGSFNTYGMGSEGQIAKSILEKHGLITYRNPGSNRSISDITPEGLKVLKTGGIQSYLELQNQDTEGKQRLELEKLQLEVDTLRNQLFDYEKVKSQSRTSIICAIISAVASLIAIIISIVK